MVFYRDLLEDLDAAHSRAKELISDYPKLRAKYQKEDRAIRMKCLGPAGTISRLREQMVLLTNT